MMLTKLIFMRILFKSGEEQAVLMNDASGDQHHRLPHGTDWRRSRSESSVPADDMETSYVPTTAYLPGPHRRHHVRKIKIKCRLYIYGHLNASYGWVFSCVKYKCNIN